MIAVAALNDGEQVQVNEGLQPTTSGRLAATPSVLNLLAGEVCGGEAFAQLKPIHDGLIGSEGS